MHGRRKGCCLGLQGPEGHHVHGARGEWGVLHDRATFDLHPVPAGWHCTAIGDYSALAKMGQCTTKQGGIFEWLPKRKR